MHAVGDRPDRHLGLVEGRPQAVEHAAADVAVEQGHAVGALGQAEAHHRHVEHRRVATVVVLGAEREDPLDGDAGGRAGLAEVLLDQRAREPVDARRHRRVGGEHGGRTADLERGVEVELRTTLLDGELADPLEAEEAGVALVGVEDLRRRGAGDPRVDAQRAHATDTEEQLLAQAVLAVAAVEAVGHVAVVLGVALDVGVQEQQRHPADAGDPDLRQQIGAVRERDRDQRPRAVLLAQQRDRQAVGVEDRVGLLLPALTGQRLLEVAVPVEQPDAGDRDAEVAGGLEVVAGEDAEAAGVLREDGGDAELRGEVGHGAGPLGRLAPLEPAVAGQVALEVGAGLAEPLEEGGVAGQLLEPGPADRSQQGDGVAPRRLPEHRVDGREDVLRLRVPGPPEVAGQVPQGGQGRREDGTDRESSNRTHERTVA